MWKASATRSKKESSIDLIARTWEERSVWSVALGKDAAEGKHVRPVANKTKFKEKEG